MIRKLLTINVKKRSKLKKWEWMRCLSSFQWCVQRLWTEVSESTTSSVGPLKIIKNHQKAIRRMYFHTDAVPSTVPENNLLTENSVGPLIINISADGPQATSWNIFSCGCGTVDRTRGESIYREISWLVSETERIFYKYLKTFPRKESRCFATAFSESLCFRGCDQFRVVVEIMNLNLNLTWRRESRITPVYGWNNQWRSLNCQSKFICQKNR